MKKCTKCGIIKEESEFAKKASVKSGIASACKECNNKHGKNWYLKNKDKKNKQNKEYQKKNHNYLKKKSKEYREANKEKIKENDKEYREKNKEKIKEYSKKYYRNNKEYYNELNKKNYEKNKDKYLETRKKYEQNNKEKIKERKKKYAIKNKEDITKRKQEYYYDNKELYKKLNYIYRNSFLNWKSKSKMRSDIEKYENIKKSDDNYLMIQCAYCGKWYKPIIKEIKNRLNCILYSSGEGRFYDTEKCKQACPTYYQKLYFKDQKPATSREVQPQVRQMVFERDNWTCQKCNTHKDDLEVPIHCHHIDPVSQNPIESADVDNCITLCKDCHKEVHQLPDCGYAELRCA